MAKSIYTGISGIARNTKSIYVGVNGVARKVTKGYIGVGGVAKQCWPSIIYTWKKYNITYSNTISLVKSIDRSYKIWNSGCGLTFLWPTTWGSYVNYKQLSPGTFTTSNISLDSSGYLTYSGANFGNYYRVRGDYYTWESLYNEFVLGFHSNKCTYELEIDKSVDPYDYYLYCKDGSTGPMLFHAYYQKNVAPVYWQIDIYTSRRTSSRGSYITDVTSENPSAYPTDGISGSYWYVKQS